MVKRITAEDVRAFILAKRESEEPDAILEILRANNGKKYTVHLLRKLPGGEERWRYSGIAGMSHLEERKRDDGAISFLTSYDRSGPHVIDAAWVEEHNPAWYLGRRERNAKRDATLADPEALDRMAFALNAYVDAKAALDEAKRNLDKLTGYGEPFSPDQYDFERLCGAREERKR
jgi:hypothetical protein